MFFSPLSNEAFVLFRFLSTYTRRMLVVSQTGQFLMIEDNAAVTPNTPIYQVNLPGTSLINLDVSTSMQAMTFADSSKFYALFCTIMASWFIAICVFQLEQLWDPSIRFC